jgi:chromosome segregation ATPase
LLASALAELEQEKKYNRNMRVIIQKLEDDAAAQEEERKIDAELLVRAGKMEGFQRLQENWIPEKSEQLEECRVAHGPMVQLNQDLKKEIEEKDKGLDFLHQRCREAEKKIVEYENSLAESQKSEMKLSGEVHCLHGELDRVRKDRDSLIEQVWHKDQEAKETKKALEKAQSDVKESLTIRQVLSKEIMNVRSEVGRLHKERDTQATKFQELEKKYDGELEAMNHHMFAEVDRLQHERERISLRAQNLEEDLGSKLEKKYAAKIKTLESDLDAEKQVANICIAENDRLMREASARDQEVAALNGEILEQRNRARALDDLLEKKSDNLRRAQAVSERLLTQVENLRQSREEVEREAESEQQNSAAEIEVLKQTNEDLTAHLQAAEAKVAAWEHRGKRKCRPAVSKRSQAAKNEKLEQEKAAFQSIARAFWH